MKYLLTLTSQTNKNTLVTKITASNNKLGGRHCITKKGEEPKCKLEVSK